MRMCFGMGKRSRRESRSHKDLGRKDFRSFFLSMKMKDNINHWTDKDEICHMTWTSVKCLKYYEKSFLPGRETSFLVSPLFLLLFQHVGLCLTLMSTPLVSFYSYLTYSAPLYLPNHSGTCEHEEPQKSEQVAQGAAATASGHLVNIRRRWPAASAWSSWQNPWA